MDKKKRSNMTVRLIGLAALLLVALTLQNCGVI